MTDKELIALFESKLPQELTLDEIQLLRVRLRESPAVRQAFSGRLQLDQYLCATVGRVELSADSIFAAAARANRFRRGGLWSWLGWGVCLLMVGFVVWVLAWPLVRPQQEKVLPGGVADAGKNPPVPSAAKALDAAAEKARPAGANGGGAKEHAGGEPGAKNPGERAGDHAVQEAGAEKGPKQPPGRIEIDATLPARSAGVEVDRNNYGRGIGIIRSVAEHSFVEYDFNAVVPGNYQLEIRYAAAPMPRPTRLSINGTLVKERATAEVTGSLLPQGQQSFLEGVFPLKQGKNTLRLEPHLALPHLSRLALTPVVENNPPVAAAPLLPWETEQQLAAPPRPFAEIAFQAFGGPQDIPSLAEVHQWFKFSPVAERTRQLTSYLGMQMASIDGLVQFNAPWMDDNLLRLAIYNCQDLAIYFWNGRAGAALRWSNPKWTLTVYATRRDDTTKPVPGVYTTTASDDGRDWRVGSGSLPSPMRLDLRFRGGELIVSRGGSVLLRAPFDGLPSETFFDTHCLVFGIAMERATGDLPLEPELLAKAADISRVGDLPWKGEPVAGVDFVRPADGSVELKSRGAQKAARQYCDLPRQGHYEVDLELDDVAPGGRVLFGPAGAECPNAVAFFDEESIHSMSCRLVQAADRRTVFDRSPFDGVAVGVAGHVWLRLVGSCGMVKCYGSADGLHWARFGAVEGTGLSSIGRIGLECLPGGKPSGIRLRHVVLGEFSQLSKLAPAELVAKAPALSGATLSNMSNWLAEVAKRQPAGVDADQWRRACALRTLSGDLPAPLGRELLAALWADSLARPMPTDDRIRLLAEMALWTNVWTDADAAAKFAAQYEQLGEKLAGEGEPAAWATAVSALGRAPIWAQGVYPTTLNPLARDELLRSIYSGRPDRVEQTLARLRTLNVNDPQLEPLLQWTDDWLAAVSPATAKDSEEAAALPETSESPAGRVPLPRRNLPGNMFGNNAPANIIPGGPAAIQRFHGDLLRRAAQAPSPYAGAPRIERRHPLIEEFNKEGFSLLADFESALDSQAYKDACQVITSAAADVQGLTPDPRDRQLFVSLDVAVENAMHRDAALREMMVRQFGPLGMLQVHRAIGEDDVPAVESAAVRYRGTEAAAEAMIWLGDRALSGGDFSRARAYYRQAMREPSATVAERAAPRDRLAAAMLGIDAGKPATGPVTLGEVQLTADKFESLVAQMRKKAHASDRAMAESSGEQDAAPQAPAPGRYDLREMALFDGEMGTGDRPADVANAQPPRGNAVHWRTDRTGAAAWSADPAPAEITRGLDWAGRQLAAAHDDARLYVGNRFQVIAYDLKTGSRQWQVKLADESDNPEFGQRAPGLLRPTPNGQNPFGPPMPGFFPAGPRDSFTHDWTLTPMRPLPHGDRVYVRRLTPFGPDLVALEKERGRVLWRSRGGLLIASDPLWVGGELLAIGAARSEQQTETHFSLVSFDPDTGQVLRQQRIAAAGDGWWQQRVCQCGVVGDHLIVLLGGAVVCCDLSGKLCWTRRQEWIPPAVDPDWATQYQAPPLADGDHVLVTQPGVKAVECIDIGSGALVWRAAMPGIYRLNGIVAGRLIVETDAGISALSLAKGEPLWHHDAADLLEGQLCGGGGQLVYSCREPVPGEPRKMRPALVWLDPANGREVHHAALDALACELPMFGPFVSAGDRLWVFAASGENEPTRAIYELTQHTTAFDEKSAPPRNSVGAIRPPLTPAEFASVRQRKAAANERK